MGEQDHSVGNGSGIDPNRHVGYSNSLPQVPPDRAPNPPAPQPAPRANHGHGTYPTKTAPEINSVKIPTINGVRDIGKGGD